MPNYFSTFFANGKACRKLDKAFREDRSFFSSPAYVGPFIVAGYNTVDAGMFYLVPGFKPANMPTCHQCGSTAPDKARFCPFCGTPQRPRAEEPPFIDLKGDVEARVVALFFDALRQEAAATFPGITFQALSEKLYASGFRDMLHRRISQLAEQIKEKKEDWTQNSAQQKSYLIRLFDELIDYFFIRHAADVLPFTLPESVLKYQQQTLASLDRYNMVMDYLDWSTEKETVYTDFLVMPVGHLKNASRYFLFPEKNERIYFICDQSIFGGCTDGFAMTERGLYWKAPLAKAKKCYYDDLEHLELSKEWLTINGAFFNAGPTLNYKVYKLMKKLRQLIKEL